MELREGFYWFQATGEDREVCKVIAVQDLLCAFFFFGRKTPIPVSELRGRWVRIEPPAEGRTASKGKKSETSRRERARGG